MGYFIATLTLLSVSIVLQIIVGFMYLMALKSWGEAKKMNKEKLKGRSGVFGQMTTGYGTFRDIDGVDSAAGNII